MTSYRILTRYLSTSPALAYEHHKRFASHSYLLAAQQGAIKLQLAIRNGAYVAFVGGVELAPPVAPIYPVILGKYASMQSILRGLWRALQ